MRKQLFGVLSTCLTSKSLSVEQIIMLTGCLDQFLHRKSRVHYFCYWHKILLGHSVISHPTLSSHNRRESWWPSFSLKKSHLCKHKKMFIYFTWALVSWFLFFFPAHWMFNSHCTIHSNTGRIWSVGLISKVQNYHWIRSDRV